MLVITGANRGLGYALSSKYSSRGLTRSHFDLDDHVELDDYLATAVFPIEPLHIINFAAISRSGFIHKQDWRDVWQSLNSNLYGSWNLLRGFQGVCKERVGSTITLVSSVVTERPVAGTSAYSMSKGGVESLTKVAALEFARIGTRVNCLQLGYFDQGMIEQVPLEIQTKVIEDTPLKRLGNVEDLWEAWQFLIKCKFVTGAIIPVNGGLA